jgi:hypothetical protein
LFAINGVRTVFLGSDFVSITKADEADWSHLKPQALAAIVASIAVFEQIGLLGCRLLRRIRFQQILKGTLIALEGADVSFERLLHPLCAKRVDRGLARRVEFGFCPARRSDGH